MLAKVIRSKRRPTLADAGFTRRVTYVCRKAASIVLGNLAGSWTDAAFQMTAVAGMNERVRKPCYHMVLSWGDGENPDDRQVLAAARDVLRRMGWQEHQYVLAVHRDRLNVHVHVVLNRVHPLSGKTFSVSHDYARLELACRVIERAWGWPADRGRFLSEVIDGVLRLVPRPQSHWAARQAARAEGLRPDPRTVRGAERRTGLAPLRDRLSTQVIARTRRVIRQAADWAALHAGLLGLGLHYRRHGSGARIVEAASGACMPACHLGSNFGLHRLQARLGVFRPGPVRDPATPSAVSRVHDSARGRHAQARSDRRERLADLRKAQKEQRRRLADRLRGLHPHIAAAVRMVLRADQRIERERLHAVPLPRLADFGVSPPATDTLGPEVQQERRHRHVLRRQRVMTAGGQIGPEVLDHTHARQLWQQAASRKAREDADAEGETAALHPVGEGRRLLARCDLNGAILGYDLLVEDSGHLVAHAISGGDLGLGLLGPRDARRCVVTADAAMAAMLAALRPRDLFIAAAPTLSARTARQLVSVVGRRPLHVVCLGDADAGFVAQVQALLPHATRLEPRESPEQDTAIQYVGKTAIAPTDSIGSPGGNRSGQVAEPYDANDDDPEADASFSLST